LILQTLPAVGLGLFTRRFHRTGLIAGWCAGMASGVWMLYTIPNPVTHRAHFGGSAFNMSTVGGPNVAIYAGFIAVAVNLAVAIIGTWIARAVRIAEGHDATASTDYYVDR
jgi:SSS family solute:Na+ symporter